jgi:hypothetical protein
LSETEENEQQETGTLALDAWHRGKGARMVEFAGYWMPIHYNKETGGGIVAEHDWTRSNAGLFDVSHMGQLMVTGERAAEELEKLLPGAIATLKPGRVRYSLLLNDEGGILDDLMVTNATPWIEGDDEAGTGRQTHFANMNLKTLRPTDGFRIVAEAVLGLGHADRQVPKPHLGDLAKLGFGLALHDHVFPAVDILDNLAHLHIGRIVQLVNEVGRSGSIDLQGVQHLLGQLYTAFAAAGETEGCRENDQGQDRAILHWRSIGLLRGATHVEWFESAGGVRPI